MLCFVTYTLNTFVLIRLPAWLTCQDLTQSRASKVNLASPLANIIIKRDSIENPCLFFIYEFFFLKCLPTNVVECPTCNVNPCCCCQFWMTQLDSLGKASICLCKPFHHNTNTRLAVKNRDESWMVEKCLLVVYFGFEKTCLLDFRWKRKRG